jgi:protein-S-isoprenylcysteine O-methyltransferase Ste14
MTSEPFVRVGLLALLLAFFVFAMIVPIWRVRRATGVQPVVVHEQPLQRVVGVGMGFAMGGAGLWGALVAALGLGALGVWHAPDAVVETGWAALALGLVVTVVAQVQMGASWRIGIDERPTTLVATGLYRLVRNPIYAGVLATVAGLALVTPCAWTLSLMLDTALLVAIQARLEEAHLMTLHGNAYRAYAARVGRFVPGFGRLAGPV